MEKPPPGGSPGGGWLSVQLTRHTSHSAGQLVAGHQNPLVASGENSLDKGCGTFEIVPGGDAFRP
jgi:hypothetical protein